MVLTWNDCYFDYLGVQYRDPHNPSIWDGSLNQFEIANVNYGFKMLYAIPKDWSDVHFVLEGDPDHENIFANKWGIAFRCPGRHLYAISGFYLLHQPSWCTLLGFGDTRIEGNLEQRMMRFQQRRFQGEKRKVYEAITHYLRRGELSTERTEQWIAKAKSLGMDLDFELMRTCPIPW